MAYHEFVRVVSLQFHAHPARRLGPPVQLDRHLCVYVCVCVCVRVCVCVCVCVCCTHACVPQRSLMHTLAPPTFFLMRVASSCYKYACHIYKADRAGRMVGTLAPPTFFLMQMSIVEPCGPIYASERSVVSACWTLENTLVADLPHAAHQQSGG